MEQLASARRRSTRTPLWPILQPPSQKAGKVSKFYEAKQQVSTTSNSSGDENSRNPCSKSATLDSGIRSLDHLLNSPLPNRVAANNMCNDNSADNLERAELMERHKQQQTPDSKQQQRSKSFSLKRSLSFRAKRASDRWLVDEPISSNIRCNNNNKEDQQQQDGLQQQEATSAKPAVKLQQRANLLFRSKSLRLADRPLVHFSSHCDTDNYRKTATIDYLAAASNKRHSSSCRKEEFIPRKIIMFLRKLFTSRNRNAGPVASSEPVQPQQAPSCNIFLTSANGLPVKEHLERGEETHQQTPLQRPLRQCWSRQSSGAATTGSGKFPSLMRSKSHRSARSPGAPSSGASSESASSLIEILDCSRRQLREESLVVKRNRAAAWQLINRSDSSLSRASDASCSTSRSTASQQLRRHLDEAYRRHRKCTSKRERDFLDSINVLRQASRHALQSPGWGARSRAKSAASSAGEQDSGCHCHSWQPELEQAVGDVASPERNQEWTHVTTATGQHHQPVAWSTNSQRPVSQQQMQPPIAVDPSTSIFTGWTPSDCCLCTMYLASGAHLTCPYTCCPAMTADFGGACCLDGHQKSLHHQSPPGRLPDLQSCCPIWRSVLHGYHQQQQHQHQQQHHQSSPPPPPPPPSAQQHLLTSPIQSLESLEKLVTSQQVLHQSQHQHQQHQHHNTTIDLKIEIGGEFSSSSISGSGGEDEKEWTCESLESGGGVNVDKELEIDSMEDARMPLKATYYADQ